MTASNASTAMQDPEYMFARRAINDKWLILFLLLLLVSLSLFVLDYLAYPYGIMILSFAVIARLSAIAMMDKP